LRSDIKNPEQNIDFRSHVVQNEVVLNENINAGVVVQRREKIIDEVDKKGVERGKEKKEEKKKEERREEKKEERREEKKEERKELKKEERREEKK
jgi:hypothetical protein